MVEISESVAAKLGRAALLISALALAGCQVFGSGEADYDLTGVNPAAGSEANIVSLTAAIEQNPSDANAYNVRGTAYGQAGALREALADFNRAIELNPNYYQAYANRALVHRRMNDVEAALGDYGLALQANPNYEAAYTGRGNIYRAAGQYDLALADYNRVIELNPVDPRGYHYRGLIFQQLGNHASAIADFTTAIGYASLAGEPYTGRGSSYYALGDYRAARNDFAEAARRDPSIATWMQLARVQEQLGDLTGAYGSYVQALYVDPAYTPARDALARLPVPPQGPAGAAAPANNPITAPVTPVILTE